MAEQGFENQKTTGCGGELRDIKIAFWSVYGITVGNDYVKKEVLNWIRCNDNDIVVMVLSLVEAKYWPGVEKQLPEEYTWKCQHLKAGMRGVESFGIVVGVRNKKKPGLKILDERAGTDIEGMLFLKLEVENVIWNVCAVDGNKNIWEILEVLQEKTKGRGVWILGGYYRARVGELEGGVDENGKLRTRRSEDKEVDMEGKQLIKWIQTDGWDLLNGCTEGDMEGKCTVSNSMMDMVIVRGIPRRNITKFVVEDKHQGFAWSPVRVEIKTNLHK